MNDHIKSIKIGSNPSISVDYSGEGEMIVFLHGIGGNKKNWDENIKFFSKKFFLSVAWDTRGYGESDDYIGNLNFQDVLDDLKKVLKYFNKDKAHIVGLSMGGQIATLFYEKFPELVKSLILCDTHFGLSNLSLIGDMNNKTAYGKLVKSMSILHKNSYLKTIEASMRTEHRHVFETINIPTLIMVGELDTLTPPSMAKDIKEKIPNSLIKIIPNAGHLINIEQPKLFNDYLLSFLKNLK